MGRIDQLAVLAAALARRHMTALHLVATIAVLADTGRLPFDTTGAGRGEPPNRFETRAVERWLGGDSLLVAEASGAGQVVTVRTFGRDTTAMTLRWRTIALADCPVELRLYTDSPRRRPPAWRSSDAPGRLRCPVPVTPGSWGEREFSWPVAAILGDSLPARRYFFGYTVRLADGRAVRYSVGESDLTRDTTPALPAGRDLAALHFTSSSQVAGQFPVQLRVTTIARNAGARPVHLAYGACAHNFDLRRTPDRRGSPVWSSNYRRPIQRAGGARPLHYACPLVLYTGHLQPGDTLVFRQVVPLREILADSMPDGTYRVRAELRVANDLPGLRVYTNFASDAGTVRLRRAADPPPTVRMMGPLRVEAATRIVPGPTRDRDSVKTFVLVTNTSKDSAEVPVIRGSPVMAYGFRSPAARDSAPASEPAFTVGGGQVVPHRFILGPGRKWLFENGRPVGEVVKEAGAGRYWLLAWLAGPVAELGAPLLSAGSVDLRR